MGHGLKFKFYSRQFSAAEKILFEKSFLLTEHNPLIVDLSNFLTQSMETCRPACRASTNQTLKIFSLKVFSLKAYQCLLDRPLKTD